MTTGRKPAGAPEGWEDHQPAGSPGSEAAPASAPERRQTSSGPEAGGANARSTGGAPPSPSDAGSEQRVEDDLDALLADVKRERDEYLQLAQRAKADFENYRKRAGREVEEAERRGKAGIVRDLIPVVDNLERALRAAAIDPDTGNGEEGSDGGLTHGVRLVYRDLRAALERAGVEAYDPAGEKFDPEWHEAIATTPADGVESGVIVETAEKGYRLNGQVLRAARVIVSE